MAIISVEGSLLERCERIEELEAELADLKHGVELDVHMSYDEFRSQVQRMFLPA